MTKLVALVLLLGSGCTFTRIRYPSIADAEARIHVCAPDPQDAPNGKVCWDAATVFHEAMEEHRRLNGKSL